MNGDLLRLIDSIQRDKGIDKEILFQGIESALLSAARKHYNKSESLQITIDRSSGKIKAHDDDGSVEPSFLGRIAAQTAKQVIIQKIKEAESDVIYADMEGKKGDIITGSVQRFDYGNLIVNFNKLEGILPKSEQIPIETYRPGDRIKALVLNIKKDSARVNIILSRSHPKFIQRLFELEVPEIADKIIEIRGVVREPGFRTKISVSSSNPKVDAVGACVGVRGLRIKNILEEVYGEKIDIIKWDETPEIFIKNSMKPAEVEAVEIMPDSNDARVFVRPDQLSLAIGRKGQNIRLVCKLTNWNIDVVSLGGESSEETESEKSGQETDASPKEDNADKQSGDE